ncbi:MAG: LPS export ABC transporter periplasmic protein LptC [Pseudomonadota bacterium]|nr:LPS export ABC transporter periplasmic protein LptC [Pseudomonadota bacterium]
MLNSRFIIFTLVLSAFALWFVFQQTSQKIDPSSSSLESSGYSWQLFNSTTWQVDKTQNRSDSIIKAETLFYDEAAKQSDFTQPRITLTQADETLFIQSETGHSVNDSQIELNGKVVVMQIDKTRQNKTLKTEHITYNPNTQIISSDQHVEISQPNSLMTGTGLKADIKNNHYQLLSNVKGEYRPDSTQK